MTSVGPYNTGKVFSHLIKKSEPIAPRCGNFMTYINTNQKTKLFSLIVKKANMEKYLCEHSSGHTLFVPVDTMDNSKILSMLDPELARKIVNYSMLPYEMDLHTLKSNPFSFLTTKYNHSTLRVSTMNNETLLDGNIKLLHGDAHSSDGIIHLTDKVLFPTTQI